MSFFGELKRRNVTRVAGVYIIVGWILVQHDHDGTGRSRDRSIR